MKITNRNDIKLIVYDFDGVLTDNRVLVFEDGREAVYCNRSDGWYIGKIRELGIEQIILSTEKNPVVTRRGDKLKLSVYQDIANKWSALSILISEKKISAQQVLYIGNDLNDWDCLTQVGYPLCPADAHEKLKTFCKVLPANGGQGIVTHLYDLLAGQT